MKNIFESNNKSPLSQGEKGVLGNKEKLWNKIGKDRLVICILGGLLLIVIAIPVDKQTKNQENSAQMEETASKQQESAGVSLEQQKGRDANESFSEEEYGQLLSDEVEEILKYMDGVGKVKVLVTMETSGEVIVEKDSPFSRSNTVETDGEGGSRNISEMNNQEETVYITDSQGNKTPYVVKEMAPLVKGIVVVAEGGEKSEIKENITEALVALFDIEPHKIKVVKMRGDLE